MELVKNINEKNFDKVWAAVPENIEWENISDFRYKQSKPGFDDIEIQHVVELFKDSIIPNIDSLKSKKVYAMSVDGYDSLYDWSIYNCLIAEIEYNGNAYCLNFGKWYKVDKDFVGSINNYYKSIEISGIEFPINTNEREDEYNKNYVQV